MFFFTSLTIYTGLGCGTLYVYSAYSTQLADRLGFSATQSSLIGMMGTIGVSLLGVIAGVIVDRTGPRIPTFVGALLLFVGYFVIYHCYVNNIRAIPLIAIASCAAGFGSSLAYSSSMKTAALNYPHSRGTATAFPIATFGLSAFFFSSMAAIFFPGNTASFLLMLALVTSALCFVNAPFLTTPTDTTLSGTENSLKSDGHSFDFSPENSNGSSSRNGLVATTTIPCRPSSTPPMSPSTLTRSSEFKKVIEDYGSTSPSPQHSRNASFSPSDLNINNHPKLQKSHQSLATLNDANTSSSLLSNSPLFQSQALSNSAPSFPTYDENDFPFKKSSSPRSHNIGNSDIYSKSSTAQVYHHHHLVKDTHDISGFKMLARKEFWAQFLVLGILGGSGQMYIYCCGYIVRALALAGNQSNNDGVHSKPISAEAIEALEHSVQGIQQFQVAIISLSSFAGRIISGVMSDVFHHHFELQRLWMIFTSCCISIAVHLVMTVASFGNNPVYLWPLSCCIGLSYGLAFGVFPTIVADTFGMFRYSQNWGMVCVSPVFGVYMFNYIFGRIYDSKSTKVHDDEGKTIHVCLQGSNCYSDAFIYTACFCTATLVIVGWMIWTRKHQHPDQISKSFGKVASSPKTGRPSTDGSRNTIVAYTAIPVAAGTSSFYASESDQESDTEETDAVTRSMIIP